MPEAVAAEMALHSADAGGGIASVSAERSVFQDALDDARRSRQIEAVITVMEKFGDSAYIQRSGCEALQGQFLQVRDNCRLLLTRRMAPP